MIGAESVILLAHLLMNNKSKRTSRLWSLKPIDFQCRLGWKITWLILIVLLCLWVYGPALSGQFVLDDDGLLTQSAVIRAPDGLSRIWLSTEPFDYWPITNTALWMEWRTWGGNPSGYHIVNLAIHIFCSLLLWRILVVLGIPGGNIAALLFAVHPVNVESVAWISQLKGLLAMLFFLLSLLFYLRDDDLPVTEPEFQTGRRRSYRSNIWYWLSLLAFLAAMLSKGSVAVLPVVLSLVALYKRGQFTGIDILRSVPFFTVAAGLTAVNIWFQRHGQDVALRDAGIIERTLGAGSVIWFYLGKALLPLDLILIYPQWRISIADVHWWMPLVAAICTTAILVASRPSRFARAIAFAWLFFCVGLLPVMGFTDVGFMKHSLVADHYQYLALLAVAAAAGAAWNACWNWSVGRTRWVCLLTITVVIAGYSYSAKKYSELFSGPIALYEATLGKNPNSWLVHNNYALKLIDAQRKSKAINEFEQAIRLRPDFALAHNNLGSLLLNVGRPAEAIRQLEQAIRLDPKSSEAHCNLGIALVHENRMQEAIQQYREAILWDPKNANAYLNLGDTLDKLGQADEAMHYYRELLEFAPAVAAAHNNLGNDLLQLGSLNAAIEEYALAVHYKPDYSEARFNLGKALLEAEQPSAAARQFQQVLVQQPTDLECIVYLVDAYAREGNLSDAIQAARHALNAAQLQHNSKIAAQMSDWLTAHANLELPANNPADAAK